MKHSILKTAGIVTLLFALALPTAAAAYTATITQDEAQSIALTHAGIEATDTTYITSKLERDDGVWEYDVEFWVGTTEYDYEINATTGAILSYDKDVEKTAKTVESTSTVTVTTATTSYITQESATSIALTHAGIAQADVSKLKVDFDMDKGVAEYEVEWKIGNLEYEYTIQATTGAILDYEIDRD